MMYATHNSTPKNDLSIGVYGTGGGSYPLSTTTEPESDGSSIVIDCAGREIQLFFFGEADDNEASTVILLLWKKVFGATPTWVARVVSFSTLTYSAALAGVAGGVVGAAECFVDTITELLATADPLVTLRSLEDDQLACMRVETSGYQKLQVVMTLGDATSMNVCHAVI